MHQIYIQVDQQARSQVQIQINDEVISLIKCAVMGYVPEQVKQQIDIDIKNKW